MQITIGEQTFSLTFKHEDRACWAWLERDTDHQPTLRQSAYVGVAFCHPKDQYCRFTGRKMALEHLLQGWCREERATVWKQYWLQSNRPTFVGETSG